MTAGVPIGHGVRLARRRWRAQVVEARYAPVAVWSGWQSYALRMAYRMSVRGFAAYTGVSERTISKWEAAGRAIRPRPDSQAILDEALRQCTAAQRAVFQAVLRQGQDQTAAEVS